jgi:hypothetical protein
VVDLVAACGRASAPDSAHHRLESGLSGGVPGDLDSLKPASCRLLAQMFCLWPWWCRWDPMTYRLAFQPLAEASVLVLLIVPVASILRWSDSACCFLARKVRARRHFRMAASTWGGDGQWPNAVGAWLQPDPDRGAGLFFERTIYGKALRATAMNRTGARLMGISTVMAGKLSFLLASSDRSVFRGPDRADHHGLL